MNGTPLVAFLILCRDEPEKQERRERRPLVVLSHLDTRIFLESSPPGFFLLMTELCNTQLTLL